MMIEEIKAAAFKAEIEKAQQKMHGYKKEIEKFASMLLTEAQSDQAMRDTMKSEARAKALAAAAASGHSASGGLQQTQSQRVARAQAALVARGGRRIGGYLQPEAAQALAALAQAGYGKNQVDVVSRALVDAQRRISKAKPATL